mgnify:CR=1 FL=1
MNFLNPLFLALLAAAAIPLVIHLFSRRKVREVRFSTLRFLALSDRRSMRRINLRRLILLALRMAAIALIALAANGKVCHDSQPRRVRRIQSRPGGIHADRVTAAGPQYIEAVRGDRAFDVERFAVAKQPPAVGG